MRDCPFANCQSKIDGGSFCCSAHWSGLTRGQRDQAFDFYRRYLQRDITHRELEELRIGLVEEVEFGRSFGYGDDPPLHHQCRCGVLVIEALLQVGCPSVKVLLEPRDTEGGLFVVVNGRAFHGPEAAELSKNAPALARLAPHTCWAVESGKPKGGEAA